MYKKDGIDSNRMVDFINQFINGKYKNKLIILDKDGSYRNQLVKNIIKKIIIYCMLFYINIIQMR